MHNKTFSQIEVLPVQRLRKENSMNRTRRLVGKLGVLLCGALLGAQTGCIPGSRGGPPGLPGLPGLPGGPGGPRGELSKPPGISLASAKALAGEKSHE